MKYLQYYSSTFAQHPQKHSYNKTLSKKFKSELNDIILVLNLYSSLTQYCFIWKFIPVLFSRVFRSFFVEIVKIDHCPLYKSALLVNTPLEVSIGSFDKEVFS